MFVCVNPKQFLPRLKALAPLLGRHYPSPILETVQLVATEDGRGMLTATNLDAGTQVEVPLLKVIRPGAVQLPTHSVIKAIGDAKTGSVDIEELAPDTLPLECRPEGAEPEGCRADDAVLRDAPDLGPAPLPDAHAGGTHARRRDPRLEVPAATRPDPLRDRSGLDPVCPRRVCLRVQPGHASLYRHGRTMPRPCV